jgi:hypothetical protein
MIRFIALIILLCLPLVFSDCKGKDENCTDNDYANCDTTRPRAGSAEVSITHNFHHKEVEVSLYDGNFEDGRLIWKKTYSRGVMSEILDVETSYSFTATYYAGNDTLLVIDGGKVRVKSYSMCELTCYEARKLRIDLTLD